MKHITTASGSTYFLNEKNMTFARAQKGEENHALTFHKLDQLRVDTLEVHGRFVGQYQRNGAPCTIISTEILSIVDYTSLKNHPSYDATGSTTAREQREAIENLRRGK